MYRQIQRPVVTNVVTEFPVDDFKLLEIHTHILGIEDLSQSARRLRPMMYLSTQTFRILRASKALVVEDFRGGFPALR